MGKFPFIVEHVAFDKRASFLQFPKKWENSHKNGKIPIKMGRFPSKWENSHKNEKIPIKMGTFP